jgi:FkbM family methyltransferase
MRKELFYNPFVLLPRLGEWAETHRRLNRLRGTVAAPLHAGHIDSLELLELLRPRNPRVIFDIGANVGTWTLLAKALYPNCEIHAFEPLKQHTAKFRTVVSGIPGITLHEVALGQEGTSARMHVNDSSDTSSILELSESRPREWRVAKVNEVNLKLRSLDEYVLEHRLPFPDLIKLDVQGFELEVLKHSMKTLAHANAVIAEVSFKEFYTGQCRFEDVVMFLTGKKFLVHAFGARTPLGQGLLQADVLFLRQV